MSRGRKEPYREEVGEGERRREEKGKREKKDLFSWP